MKLRFIPFLTFGLFLLLFSCESSKNDRILVFSKTAGYRHASIEPGKEAFGELAKKMKLDIDFTENSTDFNEKNLRNYRAVIFLSTTGDVLDHYQQADFERFIQAGGGYLGIHAASDTEYNWPWYGKLVGAYFTSHPRIQEADLQVVDQTHSSTDSLPEIWRKTDEWYNFKDISDDLNILIKIDESSYEGGKNDGNHPMAWYHEYDGGRAFYTGLGHTNESYTDPLFLFHVQGGLEYILSGEKMSYSHSVSLRVPEENRFTKVVLKDTLDEPTEMAIMDDETVLFIQRKGEVKKYDPSTGDVTQINKFDVYYDQEDGLMGLTLDPDFTENHWLYLYYSPSGDEATQHLSRFEYTDGSIDMDSEIVMLKVKTQRDQCCHTGGSLTWDGEGNLYLSTGDDTNPFESDSYAPIDERPDPARIPFDAQRSSGNTNDLRGKILRIHPEADGTYTIPRGNLFPKGTKGTQPEIYVMGNRNPYRISLDKRTGFLYWGEVGPDANDDSLGRGPMGYDEINQARQAGNFGWPYFVANNKAYNHFDFASRTSREDFNPAAPTNKSPNNSGLQDLPPATPAFIWYPYAESEEFTLVGSGGRNAMAGPVYYSEDHRNKPENALPSYFDGKLFIYDWMRGWIFAVTMNESGDYVTMEPFMADKKFNHPIDMEMGSNGVMYMLEYGTGWYSKNPDARLIRIDYNGGNRQPIVVVSADPEKGSDPLQVQFASEGSYDPDDDDLIYQWELGDGNTSTELNPLHTYPDPGIYCIALTVSDGERSTTSKMEIWVGNEPAEIEIIVAGNQSFYWKDKPFDYSVVVTDKEDGSTEDDQITDASVLVGVDIFDGNFNQGAGKGHKTPLSFVEGKRLIDGNDCLTCHKMEGQSIGPDYTSVAEKYKEQEDAVVYLSKKIISGGSGVWGEVTMAAHPDLSKEDAATIVGYILALGAGEMSGLPLEGSYLVDTTKLNLSSKLVLHASYADNGNGDIPSILSEKLIVLNPSVLDGSFVNGGEKYQVMKFSGITILLVENGGWIELNQIDLNEISTIRLTGVLLGDENVSEFKIEMDNTGIGQDIFQKLGPEATQPGTFIAVANIDISSNDVGSLIIRTTSNKSSGPAVAIQSIEFIKN